jgi:hypothetical protein
MAYELDAWTALKTACTSSATLAAYVRTFRFFRSAFQFDVNLCPVLMAWPVGVPDDVYYTFPKRKKVELRVVFTGIVKGAGDARENELLKFDALIKNAAETDITLNGKAIILNMSESTFHGLDEDTSMLQTMATITIPILTAGSR